MRITKNWIYVSAAAIVAATAIWIFAGCPTGSSSGGGGNSGGDTTVSGFSSGVITSKGSILVNGIEYDTASSTITMDNVTATAGDLAVGMMVDIKGHINSITGLGVADEILYACSIDGTIDAASINTTFSTFKVFGQGIVADLSTVFNGSTGLTGTNPLIEGDRVEISGMTNGTSILASRVERKNGSIEPFKFWGTVSSLTPPTFNLTIEAGTFFAVTYTGTLDASIVNGSQVKVETATAPSGIMLSTAAAKIELKHELSAAAGDRLELQGIIEGYSAGPPATFTINGVNVSASGSLTSGLDNGVEICVKGTLAAGVLVASEIEVTETADRELKGVVTSPNTAAGTFKLNGITVYTNDSTIFFDDSDSPVASFGLDDFASGDMVELKGYTDGTSHLVAMKVERHTGEAEAYIRSIVTASAGTNITVLGLVVDTTPLFGSTGARDIFLSSLTEGTTPIKLTGTISGTTVTWTAVVVDS